MSMTIDKFLKTLRDRNIIPHVDKDNGLNIKAPQGILTEAVIEQIKIRKEELIDYLKQVVDEDTVVINIPRASLSASYPLSSSQMRVWIMHEIQKDSLAYNIPSIVVLRGNYEPEIMEQAILSTVERHEILRTVFRQDGKGEIRQWILEKIPFSLYYLDLRSESGSMQYEKARTIIDADKNKTFDLGNGPLFRVMLFRLQEEEYLFYYNMHHLISDGWSMNILAKDVFNYYNSLNNGIASQLPALKMQYKDYAVWQRAQLETEKFKEHKNYWLGQFGGELPVLDLFAQAGRPPLMTNKGYLLETFIPEELTKSLRDFCGRMGGSLFMGLIGSLKSLFSRYTGLEDIIVGVPLAGRNYADCHDQIGFYVNTVALRTRFGKQDSFADLFRQVKKVTLEAYKHQEYPFDRLLEDLEQKRDMSRSALFDILIVLQNQQENIANGVAGGGRSEAIIDGGEAPVKFDISFEFSETEDGLFLQVLFNTDVYRKADIIRLIGHYRTLLRLIMKHPEIPFHQIDYLSETEHRQILYQFNNTQVKYTDPRTITAKFAQQARLVPNNIAIIFENRQLSYRELDERSNQLAHYLLGNGIQKEDLVPVCLEKSAELLISILGILKAGAAYVPIDPGYPADRVGFMLEDTGAGLILTDTAHEGMISGFDSIDHINLDREHAVIREQSILAPDVEIGEQQLAYVMYTSGSTGKPKGVQIEHQAVVRLVKDNGFADISSKDVVLSTGSISFDATTFEFWAPLLNGGQLVLCNQNVLLQAPRLKSLILSRDVNTMWFTAGLLHQLVDVDLSIFGSLKTLIAGGDRLSPERIKKLRLRYPSLRIINGYGPTENTTFSLCYQVGMGVEMSNVPIGRRIRNSTVYLFDDGGLAVPVGVTGQIFVGGEGLTRGYLNRPELDLERFIRNPYKPDERLYRTGDLGKWTSDGNVVFLGRVDNQVKIRGFRVEPGEIEHALMQLEEIRQAVVVAVEKENDQKYLVGYVVSDMFQNTASLKQQLLDKLPEYMIPVFFIQIDSIPLTANGKTDIKSLPLPEELGITDEVEYVAPRNEVEGHLVEIYKKIFRKELISAKDNFYELGGDSIKAILLSGQIRQKGYVLEVADILKYPVLEDLALTASSVSRTVSQEAVEGEVILTPVQRWFFELNAVNKEHYNQSVLLQSKAPVDEALLSEALKLLVINHDALRMRFEPGEYWRQYNNRPGDHDYDLVVYDLRRSKDALKELANRCEDIQRSINLQTGPLLKAGLFRLTDGDRLLLVVHHLVIDGVSWRILLEDLSTAYRQLNNNQPVSLIMKTDSFLSWASRLQAYANSDEIASEYPYWSAVVSEGGLHIPVDLPGGGNLLKHSGTKAFSLDKELSAILLTKINKVYNTDMNDLLLASLGRAVREVFGCDRIMVEMEGHGREEVIRGVDINRTVGWFTTLYPVLLDTSSSDDIIDFLIEVKEQLRKVPGKGIGYGMIRYLRDGGAAQLGKLKSTDIRFNFLGDFGEGVSDEKGESAFGYAEEKRGSDISDEFENDCLISVSGMFAGGVLHLNFKFSRELFHPQTIERLLKNYEQQLRGLVEQVNWERGRTFVTPSDLTYKGLSLNDLKKLNEDGNVEDIYELSPLQEGIYYHWLADPGTTAYVEQMSYRLKGDLDIELMRRIYSNLVKRHAVLRTSFHHEYGSGPLQVVRKEVNADFRYHDLRAAQDKEGEVRKYKENDRIEGFDLHGASQMRLSVLELGPEEYEFVWSHHHILIDGWCISLLIADFFTIWHAWAYDGVKELGKVYPYVNYIKWLKTLDRTVSRAFWSGYLEGYDQATNIPFRQDNRLMKPYVRGEERIVLDGQEMNSIRELCRELDITENTFIQGAWGYLLSRYNNTSDALFGAVVSGRPSAVEGVEKMIGLFINTIPVRIRFEKETTVSELLKLIQAGAIESMPHHYLSLSEINSNSDLRSDLFDHILVFENYPVEEMVYQGMKADESDEGKAAGFVSSEFVEQSHYDFTIVIAPSGKALKILMSYNKNHYRPEHVAHIKEHLHNTIRFFIGSPGDLLSSFNYLSSRESHFLLGELNNTRVEYSRELTILDKFGDAVERHASKTAILDGDLSLSYHELHRQSTRIAHCLQEHYQIGRGGLVGLSLERSSQMVIILLGILKAGAAYLPVDPSQPAERSALIFSDASCKLVLDKKVADHICALAEGMRETELPALHQPSQRDLAYVIYTSGSTGVPKGVMIDHGNLYNYLSYCQDTYFNEPEKLYRAPFFTSIAFDLTVTSLFGTLIAGGELMVYADKSEPGEVIDDIFYGDKRINFLKCTPSHLSLLFVVPGRASMISHLIAGGEELLPGQLQSLWSVNPDMKVYNEYGPTETTVGSVVERIEPDMNNSGGVADGAYKVPIGRPISNTRVYILDSWGQPVAAGIKGELHIGGRGVSPGYLNREELTRQKFIGNPLIGGERLYRTGDICWWREDGRMEYAGREDDQIKLRGFRVEPEEIAEKLSAIEGIETAVVTGRQDGDGQMHLVGYYKGINAPQVSEIREELLKKLPEYMVPWYFVRLDEIPVTTNGKLDRKALPAPDFTDDQEDLYLAPRNKHEILLADIYSRILHKECTGVRDHFFRQGGDSIKVILLINRLRQHGYKIRVADVLKHPVLGDLAAFISRQDGEPADRQRKVPAERGHIPDHFSELSYNQLYYCGEEEIVNSYATIDVYLEDFEKQRFLDAYQKLLSSFEMLRVRIFRQDGRYMQEILPPERTGNKIAFIEDDSVGVNNRIIHLPGKEVPFNLGDGEIMRWEIRYNRKKEALVRIAIHHIVTDNASNSRLQDAFRDLYSGSDRPISNAPHYFEFVKAQKIFFDSEEGKQQLDYWNSHLCNYGVFAGQYTSLKNGRNLKDNGAPAETSLVENVWLVKEERYQQVLDFCRQHDLFPSNFFLGVVYLFARSLHVDKEHFLIGVAINGLDISMPGYDSAEAIGQFLNLLPLCVSLARETEPLQILKEVSRICLEGRLHQQIPFRLVKESFKDKYDEVLYPDGYLSFIERKSAFLDEDAVSEAKEGRNAGSSYSDVSVECKQFSNGFRAAWNVKVYDGSAKRIVKEKVHIRMLDSILENILPANKIR